jgi:hypothetical protein
VISSSGSAAPACGRREVVNPQAAPSGIIGCGGALGAMGENLIIENAIVGKSLAVIPGTVPYDVAALNERMAVARHCVCAAPRFPDGQL